MLGANYKYFNFQAEWMLRKQALLLEMELKRQGAIVEVSLIYECCHKCLFHFVAGAIKSAWIYCEGQFFERRGKSSEEVM